MPRAAPNFAKGTIVMANTTWNGSNDDWNTPGDWTGGVLPSGTSVVFVNSGQPQITSSSNAGTIAQLNVAGSLDFNDGALTVTGGLANTGTIFLDQYYQQGGSDLTVGGAIVNSNTIQIGSNNYSLTANDEIKAASVDNTGGTINIYGSATNTAELDITGVASFSPTAGVLAGSVNVNGYGSIVSKVVFEGGGEITTIAANSELSLGGALSSVQDGTNGANNSALTGLTTITGGLYLYNGGRPSRPTVR